MLSLLTHLTTIRNIDVYSMNVVLAYAPDDDKKYWGTVCPTSLGSDRYEKGQPSGQTQRQGQYLPQSTVK